MYRNEHDANTFGFACKGNVVALKGKQAGYISFLTIVKATAILGFVAVAIKAFF